MFVDITPEGQGGPGYSFCIDIERVPLVGPHRPMGKLTGPQRARQGTIEQEEVPVRRIHGIGDAGGSTELEKVTTFHGIFRMDGPNHRLTLGYCQACSFVISSLEFRYSGPSSTHGLTALVYGVIMVRPMKLSK